MNVPEGLKETGVPGQAVLGLALPAYPPLLTYVGGESLARQFQVQVNRCEAFAVTLPRTEPTHATVSRAAVLTGEVT